jgi:hypothetical protein
MLPTLSVRGITLDLTLALLLGYVVALWFGGWVLELLAKEHFRRAQRFAHNNFVFDRERDHFKCPQGELLRLHALDARNRLAIYKAPASTCSACALKVLCTPHDEGRRIYRSLAEFHETDIGRFHRWLSMLVLALALAFSTGGLVAWWNTPGQWPLMIVTFVSAGLLWLDGRVTQERIEKEGVPASGLV